MACVGLVGGLGVGATVHDDEKIAADLQRRDGVEAVLLAG